MTENDRPIRVGAIGCGQFMSQQHIQTIARSPRLVLEHLADIDPAKLERVAARYRPERCSTRWEDVVVDPEVQVVVVGVLPHLHPLIARAALEHGKAVYVEKPLAPTTTQCAQIDRLARDRGLAVAVGFNRRFAPATELLQQAFRTAAGPVSVFYRISDDERVRPTDQGWKKADRLLIEVVHIFDLLAFLLGAEPVSIAATEARFNDTTLTIAYDNGSRATILSSSYGSLAQPKEHLEATLDHGSVEMDDFVELRSFGLAGIPSIARFAGRPFDQCDNSHVEDFAQRGLAALLERRQHYHAIMEASGVLADSASPAAWARAQKLLGEPPPPQINYASDKGWGRALEHFCRAVVDGERPQNATAADGNRATACALAARRAIERQAPVRLEPAQWQIASG
jgi:predicted dehydrogenase